MKTDGKSKSSRPAPKQTSVKVFDVRRPGKAPASPSSRPVVIGHKPEVQETQAAVSGIGDANLGLARRKIQILPTGDIKAVNVTEPEKTDNSGESPVAVRIGNKATEEDREALATAALDAVTGPPDLPTRDQPNAFSGGSRLVIKPLDQGQEDEKPSVEDAKAEPEFLVEPESSQVPAEPSVTEKPQEKPAAVAAETPASPEQPEQPEQSQKTEVAETPSPEDQTAILVEDTTEQPEPNIEPLFDDSGVVVSHHNHRSHHGLKVVLLLLLVIVLAAAIFDIVLDLDLLEIEGIPHTDFL